MLGKVVKETTKIAGLAVSKNPHHNLTVLYDKILRALQEMPDSATYKKHTKSLVEERFNLVKTVKDPVELEKKINDGQIEEVIKQAEYELLLARKMAKWKAWEPLVGDAPKDQWKWPIA